MHLMLTIILHWLIIHTTTFSFIPIRRMYSILRKPKPKPNQVQRIQIRRNQTLIQRNLILSQIQIRQIKILRLIQILIKRNPIQNQIQIRRIKILSQIQTKIRQILTLKPIKIKLIQTLRPNKVIQINKKILAED